MPDTDLEARLDAIERTLTETDADLTALTAAADRSARLDDLEARLDDIVERQRELEASVQAIRGYVGNVRSVNREVEQRADAALAKVEKLERRLDDEETDVEKSAEPVTTPDTVDETGTHEPAGEADDGDGILSALPGR